MLTNEYIPSNTIIDEPLSRPHTDDPTAKPADAHTDTRSSRRSRDMSSAEDLGGLSGRAGAEHRDMVSPRPRTGQRGGRGRPTGWRTTGMSQRRSRARTI